MRKAWLPTLIMEIDDQTLEWKSPLAVEVEHIGKLVDNKAADLSDVIFSAASGQPIYLRAVYSMLLKRAGRPLPFDQVDVSINDTEVYLVDDAGREVTFEVRRRECGYHREARTGFDEDCPKCADAGVGPELDRDGNILWRFEDSGEPVPTRRSSRNQRSATSLSPSTSLTSSLSDSPVDPSPSES